MTDTDDSYLHIAGGPGATDIFRYVTDLLLCKNILSLNEIHVVYQLILKILISEYFYKIRFLINPKEPGLSGQLNTWGVGS